MCVSAFISFFVTSKCVCPHACLLLKSYSANLRIKCVFPNECGCIGFTVGISVGIGMM